MTFNQARIAGLSAVAASMFLAACQVTATGQVTPGTTGSASPAASGSPAATTSAKPSASPTATTSASPTTGASPSASPSTAASPAGAKTGDAEPNNDFPTASMAAWNAPISGTVGGTDSIGDYYKIDVPAGMQDGWLEATVVESSGDYAPNLEWYRASKGFMTSSSFEVTEQPATGKIRATAGGMYYVKLAPHGQAETVDYTITFKFTPVADPSERNQDFTAATTLELGKAIAFATFWGDDAAEDIDTFTVAVPAANNRLRVKIANKTTSEDPAGYTVELYSATKAFMSSASGGNQEEIDHVFEVEGGKSYFLKIKGGNTDALSDLTVTAETEATEE